MQPSDRSYDAVKSLKQCTQSKIAEEIWLFLRASGILRRSVINRRLCVEWYRPFSFAEDCLCSLWVTQELTDVDNSEVED